MNKLFTNFNHISKNKWKDKIIVDLKEKDYSKALISEIEEIKIDAIFHQDDNVSVHRVFFPNHGQYINM